MVRTLSHCWFNVSPPSTTLSQHWTNNWWMSCVFTHRWFNVSPPTTTLPRHWTNNGWMSRGCWGSKHEALVAPLTMTSTSRYHTGVWTWHQASPPVLVVLPFRRRGRPCLTGGSVTPRSVTPVWRGSPAHVGSVAPGVQHSAIPGVPAMPGSAVPGMPMFSFDFRAREGRGRTRDVSEIARCPGNTPGSISTALCHFDPGCAICWNNVRPASFTLTQNWVGQISQIFL